LSIANRGYIGELTEQSTWSGDFGAEEDLLRNLCPSLVVVVTNLHDEWHWVIKAHVRLAIQKVVGYHVV